MKLSHTMITALFKCYTCNDSFIALATANALIDKGLAETGELSRTDAGQFPMVQVVLTETGVTLVDKYIDTLTKVHFTPITDTDVDEILEDRQSITILDLTQ